MVWSHQNWSTYPFALSPVEGLRESFHMPVVRDGKLPIVISASGDGPPYRPNGHQDLGFDDPSLYPTSNRSQR
jgi:hypothetical protein